MLNYQTILLATDLSEHADLVAQKAAEIARQSKADLYVIHVIEHSPIAYGGEFSIPIDATLERTLEEQAQKGLQNLAEQHNIPAKNQFIHSGSVKQAVIDQAAEIKADLIIVGTHGHHGLDLLLGSRANAILHQAQCDVWAIRTPE